MRKLKIGFILLATVAFLWSCNKENAECPFKESTFVAPQAEKDSIGRYILANSITNTTFHPAGFAYVINSPGTGNAPTVCSTLEVTYGGFFFSGGKFDGTTGSQTAIFPLGNLILGWQKALPLIKKGGSLTMYLPPSLAYGATAIPPSGTSPGIPANSYLRFEVTIIDVQ